MPLADRIRPSTLDEVVGQRHILAQGKPLYNIISRGKIPNMIFYGPSGVGKTTVANIIAQKTSMSLYRLNGTQGIDIGHKGRCCEFRDIRCGRRNSAIP